MTIPEAIGKRTATIGSAVYDVLPRPGGRVRRAFAAVHFVRGWHKADISRLSSDVRFWGQSGHGADALECLLLTQSGHAPLRIAAAQNDVIRHYRRAPGP